MWDWMKRPVRRSGALPPDLDASAWRNVRLPQSALCRVSGLSACQMKGAWTGVEPLRLLHWQVRLHLQGPGPQSDQHRPQRSGPVRLKQARQVRPRLLRLLLYHRLLLLWSLLS